MLINMTSYNKEFTDCLQVDNYKEPRSALLLIFSLIGLKSFVSDFSIPKQYVMNKQTYQIYMYFCNPETSLYFLSFTVTV